MIDALDVQILPLDGTPIVEAYREKFPQVAQFFPAGPADRLETFKRSAERARERTPDDVYRALGELLQPTGAAAVARVQRVAREKGVVVTTGQQPGLFTGPLYSVYKALTAARLADVLEERLGLPVVAAFWVASEDHDREEVNHVHVIDLDNRLRRIQVEFDGVPASGSPPLFRLRFGSGVGDAVAALDTATPDSEFKPEVLGSLAKSYRPGAGVAAAFAEALADITRSLGLCLVEASHPSLKRLSAPILEREWVHRRPISERLAAWAAEIEAQGYDLQVPIELDATNLFVEGAQGRERLLTGPRGHGRLRHSETAIDEAEFLRFLREDPSRVTPNVLLRPVVESALFPVVAYVGGPAEIAYFAQLPPLFEAHGVPIPPVVPRASVRLLEARIGKVLEKYNVSPDDLAAGADLAARRAARGQLPERIASALESLRSATASGLDAVRRAVIALDPTLEGAAGRAESTVEKAIRELESKVTTSAQRQNELLLTQLQKAAVHLFPQGRPQERGLNIYPYLVRYGRDLIPTIAERILVRVE